MRLQWPAPAVGTLASEGLNGAFSGALASVELVLAAPLGTLPSRGLTLSGALASLDPLVAGLVELVLAQPPMGRQWPAEQLVVELEQAEVGVGVEECRQWPAGLLHVLVGLVLVGLVLVLVLVGLLALRVWRLGLVLVGLVGLVLVLA